MNLQEELFASHERFHGVGLGTMPLWGKTPHDVTRNQPLKDWLTPRFYDAPYWRAPVTGIGLLLGPSEVGNIVDVDLDCTEASTQYERLPHHTRAIARDDMVRHLCYRVEGHVRTQRWSDPLTKHVLFELRSSGTQTMIPPSIHPSGKRIVWMNRAPLACISAEELLEHLRLFAIYILSQRYKNDMPEVVRSYIERLHGKPGGEVLPVTHAVDAFSVAQADRIRRASAYLACMEPSISGQGGHNALFRAAVAMVRGFMLSEEEAFALLQSDFNPRCTPAWSFSELRRKVREASRRSTHPMGFLLMKGAA